VSEVLEEYQGALVMGAVMQTHAVTACMSCGVYHHHYHHHRV